MVRYRERGILASRAFGGITRVMHHVSSLYLAPYDFPRRDPIPKKSYALAAIPRTGSTLLAMELWRTGVLGAPMEYLNFRGVRRMRQRFAGDITRYWREVQSLRTSPNGVFGVKMFIQNYQDIGRQHPSLLPELAFDDMLYLNRRDKVAQAISYFRAIQTRAWFAGAKLHREPEYDFDGIARCETLIRHQEAAWDQLFKLTDSQPLRLYYEDLVADAAAVVEQVMRQLDVPVAGKEPLDLPPLDRQADSLSEGWRRRYENDRAAASGRPETGPRLVEVCGPQDAPPRVFRLYSGLARLNR